MVDKVSITAPDPNTITDFLSQNRKNSYLGDMMLVCEDGEVKANQSVVVANCKLFRNILRDQPHCSSYQPVIYLADQTIRNVSYLLQYLYTGSVEIQSQDEKRHFFALAEDLQFEIKTSNSLVIRDHRKETHTEEKVLAERDPIVC